jgi:hypothetical protein
MEVLLHVPSRLHSVVLDYIIKQIVSFAFLPLLPSTCFQSLHEVEQESRVNNYTDEKGKPE